MLDIKNLIINIRYGAAQKGELKHLEIVSGIGFELACSMQSSEAAFLTT